MDPLNDVIQFCGFENTDKSILENRQRPRMSRSWLKLNSGGHLSEVLRPYHTYEFRVTFHLTKHYGQPILPDLASFRSRTTGFLKMNFFDDSTEKLSMLNEIDQ